MILHLTTLLAFQLAGELISRGLGLPIPGPVIGMALIFVLFLASSRVANAILPTAQGLLAHLSLLFVPAGVGITRHLDRLGQDGPAILAAVTISTIAAIALGALTFKLVARLTGGEEEEPRR
jgi:holin-like protein